MRDLLAEAQLAKETRDFPDRANAIANLYRALVAYDVACGEPFTHPKDPQTIAQIRDSATLDAWTRWSADQVASRENMLRLGLEVELTWPENEIPPDWRPTFWK